MKITDELDYDIIAKDDWLCRPLTMFWCPVEDIVYLPSNNTGYFAHKESYYAELAGSNKRLLTTKEQFLINILRNS